MDPGTRLQRKIRQVLENHRWEVGTGILLLLSLPIYFLFFSESDGQESLLTPTQVAVESVEGERVARVSVSAPTVPSEPERFPVHLAGAVHHPGVYFVSPGSYLQQVVEEAGGLTEAADLDRVNLAIAVEGNQKYRIPSMGEQEATGEAQAETAGEPSAAPGFGSGKISLNQATEQQLCTLPGIGPSTARKILAYRKEKGAFKRLEDLMQVPGIKQARYEQLVPYLTLH